MREWGCSSWHAWEMGGPRKGWALAIDQEGGYGCRCESKRKDGHMGGPKSLKAIGRTRLPKENHLQCNPGPHNNDKLTPPCGLESILPVHSFATGREQRTRMAHIVQCTHEQPQAISMQYLVTILVLLYVNVCKCK